ncbi:MAG: oligopeptide/dipeptide ABC transporter ATP-binding protein [Actinomycetota bacterium]
MSVEADDLTADDLGGDGSQGESEVLIRVRGLKKHFPITGGMLRRQVGAVRAVDGVDFDIHRGETLGLVGESGSGKTTTGRVILQLSDATEGNIEFDGNELTELNSSDLRSMRPRMQIIFQDPQASLNPRMNVGAIIGEPFREHGVEGGGTIQAAVDELLRMVGLDPSHANRYPHEFSGGQRQRIGIARAIALSPEFIVCDEAIAALDVSIQAQVVNLLKELQGDLGLTYLFISHDLSMVEHIADRIAVMYLGRIMELANVEDLHENPRHPYTQALYSAVPVPDPVAEQLRERVILEGDIPSPSNPPSGCVFRTRCPRVEAKCASEVPEWKEAAPGHWVACHFHD